MKVSVILPTYNRTDTLMMACDSVLAQSHRDLELIIVDDASSENIEEAVHRLGDDRAYCVRRSTNGGASAARNTGLASATGEFIAFQDSDDLWLPGKLARQLALFETLPADVGVVTGSKILYGRDAAHNYGPGRVTCAPPPEERVHLEEDQVRRFLSGNRISLQNALFRRSCFPDAVWFDTCAKANADWEFTVRLVQHTKVYEDIEPVVLAFISEDSISKVTRKKILGLLRIIKKNRAVVSQYKAIYARHLIELGRMLRSVNKRRWAVRFILAGLRVRPAAAFGIAWNLVRRLAARFTRAA